MQNTASAPKEHYFLVNGLSIAAKIWNENARTKAIVLHGWLDNANSFDPLAALLPDLCIVALDSVGHGKSDFRSLDATYHIWSEVDECIQVANQLGWEQFVLMGHSRGAAIAGLVAGTFPERISHLVLLEGGIPLSMSSEQVPENLAQSIETTHKLAGTKGTLFPTREAALTARANGFTKVDMQTAEILAKRSLYEDAEGFHWHVDARLKAPSPIKLNDAQIHAFLGKISAPTLLVIGKHGIVEILNHTHAHFERITDIRKVEMPGGHHLHMEGAEEAIAKEISALIFS